MINTINDFKENKIDIFETIKNLDINNYSEEEIKENGIVYTPKYIAEYIINQLNIKEEETILEPSVGHGIFIFTLLELNKTKSNLKEWFLNKIYGYDIQEKNIEQLKELIIIYFEKLNIKITKEELTNFKVMDTLFDSTKYFDVILGNPPYIRIKNIETNYLNKLKKDYLSCKDGNIDIYYAFIEFANKYSKKSSFIVPNSYLYNKFAKNLRNIIVENLKTVIDFKEKKIFEKAGTYTSIFLINKEYQSETILYKENLTENYKELTKNKFLKKEIENTTKEYKVLNIFGPIATLRDNIYKSYKEVNIKDTIPFLKLTKLKTRQEIQENKERIIFPYKIIDKKFIIKNEDELDVETLSFLYKNKKELEQRDKGNKTYPKWYAYGRTQGLYDLKDKNNSFIIVPGMFSEDYSFFKFEKEDIKEEQFLFSSGLLIEIEKNEIELIDFLNSKDFFNKVKEIGTVKPGKKPYYSLTKPQIESLILKR